MVLGVFEQPQTRHWRRFVATFCALLLAVGWFHPTDTAAQTTEESTVRIFAALVQAENNVADRQELRSAIRDIRRLSASSPRQYIIDGTVRRTEDLRRWRVIEVAAGQAEDTFTQLQNNPAVEEVHFENIYEQAVVPDDPRLADQYGLQSANGLADIQAPVAWDKTTGSSSTIIAIIDGGVDLTHEDLENKIWSNADDTPGNGIDDDGNGYADDIHGWDFVADRPAGLAIHHATHVAGIAAASSNNGAGIAGVDWQAQIMSVRVLGSSGLGPEEDIINGINYAVANGADVINLSIVGAASPALLDAIENAYAAGVVVVAAAGNNRSNTGLSHLYPVCAQTNGVNMVLGVAATDEAGQPASFSNYGECVDVAAPGEDILSTRTGDRYGLMSGTSMSAPFAAGVAGLYLSLHPQASPADVIAALTNGEPFSGPDADEWNRDFKGRLSAAAAVGAANTSGPVPASPVAPENSSAGSSGGGGGGGSGSDGGGGGGGEPGPDPEPVSQQSSSPTGSVAGAIKKIVNSALLPKINAAFRSVFGRNPIQAEHSYWYGRVARGDKRSYGELVGAMLWRKLQGGTYDPASPFGLHRTSPAVAGAKASSLISRINAVHRLAHGRNPTVSEHAYWMGRVVRGEKKTEVELLGAMIYHRVTGILH